MKPWPWFALLLLGCFNEPQATSSMTNSAMPVELLFEHDGCRVYRFHDGGRAHYYVRCGAETSTSSTQSCGKNCRRSEYIQTIGGQL